MAGALAHDDVVALRDALSEGELRTIRGDRVRIPPAAREVLVRALEVMESSPDAAVFPADELLTTGQVAELLGVSRTTVVRLVDKGGLQASESPVHRRIAAAEVRRYQEQRARSRRTAVRALADDIHDELPPDEVPAATR